MRGVAEQRDAQADEHDAGVLDGGVAEEAPQIVLGEGVGDPGDRRQRAEDQQSRHRTTPAAARGSANSNRHSP